MVHVDGRRTTEKRELRVVKSRRGFQDIRLHGREALQADQKVELEARNGYLNRSLALDH